MQFFDLHTVLADFQIVQESTASSFDYLEAVKGSYVLLCVTFSDYFTDNDSKVNRFTLLTGEKFATEQGVKYNFFTKMLF